MKLLTSLLVLLCPAVLLATDPSPYAGEELRSIKSLSEEEIASLRRGSGMGFAKLAELHHFPGPKHVLEVAEQLEAALLDIGQLQARLRFVHLEAHLRQKRLLTPDQVRLYDAVRGYGDPGHAHREH